MRSMPEKARTAAEEGIMQGAPPPVDRRVDLANWQLPPWNRWSFQHVSEVLRTARIPREGPVWALPAGPADLSGVEFTTGSGESTTLGEWLPASFTDGLLVLRNGSVAFEHYQNGMAPETLHLSMSVGKSMTSLLVGILAGRGLVDPSSLVTDLVPELGGSGYAEATVQHLLNMAVALDYVEDYLDPAAEFWKVDVACGFIPDRPDAPAHCLIDLLPTFRRADRPHGDVFLYCSPNTDLLGIMCERATGTRFADLFARELWGPLGAEWEANVGLDPVGTAAVDGGFSVSLRDYARVGALVLNEGRAAGRQVVPEAWVRAAWEPNLEPFRRSTAEALIPGGSYRNKWWGFDGRLHAWGIHGQLIAIDPASQTVVAIVSSNPLPDDDADFTTHRNLVNALVRSPM
jgi:CubicO group peptidase (beta-lactamase class C family)